jgi:hypothetical protein
MREVKTAKGSRFLLCRLSQQQPGFAKYPPQPVGKCLGFRDESAIEDSDQPLPSKEQDDEL